MKVCVAAGGTGGHLLPGVAVAKELRRRGHLIHFVVKTDKTTEPFLTSEGFSSSSLYFEGFPRKLSPRLLTFPFMAWRAIRNARRILRDASPDVVLGMGGYITVPAGLAARRLKIPLLVHEQNSVAGLANYVLSSWAEVTAVTFKNTSGLSSQARVVHTGLPLRPDLNPLNPSEARRALQLDPEAMTLLVFGGSQGARALNQVVLNALPKAAREKKWQIIHLTGPQDAEQAAQAYGAFGVKAFVKPYWNDMATLYSAADFVIARSGAGTVMEIAHFNKHALLVPFPHATANHQEANARALEKAGLAKVVLEPELTSQRFTEFMDRMPAAEQFRSPESRVPLGLLPNEPKAAERLADLVESVGLKNGEAKIGT